MAKKDTPKTGKPIKDIPQPKNIKADMTASFQRQYGRKPTKTELERALIDYPDVGFTWTSRGVELTLPDEKNVTKRKNNRHQ